MIKDEDQREDVYLEVTQETLLFIYIYIGSCVHNFAKYANMNHLHKEKIFMEKAGYIVSWSGTEISVSAVPTQEHLSAELLNFLYFVNF